MELDGLTALIISPNSGARSRLREVLKCAIYKVSLSWVHDFRDLSSQAPSSTNYDVIILSTLLGEDVVSNFISAVKEVPNTSCPSFIVTVDGSSSGMMSKVSNLYVGGVEGFISEPYSSEELVRLLSVVREKKEAESIVQKQRKAMHFLFNEAIRFLDIRVKCVDSGKKPHPSIFREARSIRSGSENLYRQNPSLYESLLIETFETLDPPKKSFMANRKKMHRKEVLHPGLIVAQIMNERSVTIENLKSSLRLGVEKFEAFIQGQAPVDDMLSRELSRLFGKTSRDWLKLQKEFDFQEEKRESTAAG